MGDSWFFSLASIMMKSAVVASALAVASADTVNLTFQDCGSDSTHARVTNLNPNNIEVPGDSTIVGSGTLDADQTSASFTLTAKKGFMTLLSGGGSICEDTTINFPLGVGSVTVKGLECPIPAGDLAVEVDLSLLAPSAYEDGENSLISIHIEGNADDTGDQVLCLDIDVNQGPAPPSPSPEPPSPSPEPPSPAPAPSPDPPPYFYQTITPQSDTNLCVDLPGGNTENGQTLWLWECGGWEGQRWRFDSGSIRYAPDESKCVDAGDMADGSSMFLWDCNGAPQQNWGFDSDGGSVYLQDGQDASICLDFWGDWDSNGQPLHIWSCTGDWNQQWSIWDQNALSVV